MPRNTALIALWIEGIVALVFIIFNIISLTHPMFPPQDDISNKAAFFALMVLDIAVLKWGGRIVVRTIKALL